MSDSPTAFPETVAAVDLGSNSFHLIVARTESSEPVIVDRLREMVQLASGLDSKRRLSEEAKQRALGCLGRFGQRLGHMPAGAVRAVGTNTLRSARNVDGFLDAAEEALGHRIETISGMEEARLIYLGVTQSVPDPHRRLLVLDIGGGSTELIVGEAFTPKRMESFYMGCVGMSRRWFRDGGINAKRWDKAVLAARQELGPVESNARSIGWDHAIGASGTIRTVHAVVRAEGWAKKEITPKSLRRLRDAMLEAGHVDELDFEDLAPARRSVFPGGVAVLTAAFETLGIESMQASEGALREGLLYDLIGRMRQSDVRDRSVTSLGDRYHVDWKQAGRVERIALKLLGDVAESWSLTASMSRRFLSWAAQLHEIGLDIAHAHYHKHGEYIIANSDLLGFSVENQRLLGALVRAHRRRFPEALIRSLDPKRPRQVERLAVLLRLAVVFHRSRSPDALPEFRFEASKKTVHIVFPEGWLAEHPLTRTDLEQEAAYLEAIGLTLTFS